MNSLIQTLTIAAGALFAATAFAQPAMPASGPMAATPGMGASAGSGVRVPAPDSRNAAASAAAGEGKVWVNSSSKTYHCNGSAEYGKASKGEYMTEAAAKAAGNRANQGMDCAK